MEEAAKAKFMKLKAYLPFVSKMLNKLELNADNYRKEHLERLRSLHKFLTNTDMKVVNIEMLERMERLIKALYQKGTNKRSSVDQAKFSRGTHEQKGSRERCERGEASENHEYKGSDQSQNSSYHKRKGSLDEKTKDENARYPKSKEGHNESVNELYNKREKEYRRSSSYDSNKQKCNRYGENHEKNRHRLKSREQQLFGDDDVPIQRHMKDLSVSGLMQSKNSKGSLLDLPMPPGQGKHSTNLNKKVGYKNDVTIDSETPKNISHAYKAVSSYPSFLKDKDNDKRTDFLEKVDSLKLGLSCSLEPVDQDKSSQSDASIFVKDSNMSCSKSNKSNFSSTDMPIPNTSSSGFGRPPKSVAQCFKPTDIPLPTYPNRPSIRENLGRLESPEKEASFSPSNNMIDSVKSAPFDLKNNKSPGQLPAPQVNVEAIQKALNFINAHDKSKKPELGQGVSYRYEDFIGPASTSSAKYDSAEMWTDKSFSKEEHVITSPTGTGVMDIDLRTKVDIDLRQIPGQFVKGSSNSMSSVSSPVISKPFNVVAHPSSYASPRSMVGNNENVLSHQYSPNYVFKDDLSKNKDVDMRSLKPMTASHSTSVTNFGSSSTSPGSANVMRPDTGSSDSVRSRFLHDTDKIIKLGQKGVAAAQLDSYRQKREKLSQNYRSPPVNKQISSSPISSGSFTRHKEANTKEGNSILDELLPTACGKNKSHNALISNPEIDQGTGSTYEITMMKGSSLNKLSTGSEFEVTSSISIDTSKQLRTDKNFRRSLDTRNINNRLNIPKVFDKNVRGNNGSKYGSSSHDPSRIRDPRTLMKNCAPYDQRFGDEFPSSCKDSNLNTNVADGYNSSLPQRRDPRLNAVDSPTDPRVKNNPRDPRNAPSLSSQKWHLESNPLPSTSSLNSHTPFSFNPVSDKPKYGINYNYSNDRPQFPVNMPSKMTSQPSLGNHIPGSFNPPQRLNQYFQSQSSNSCSAIKDTFTCLIMRGLPQFTNSSHIYQFFEEYILRDLCIELDEAYNCKGTAYIHFPSHLSAKKALEVENGKSLLNFEISLGICSVGFLNQAKRVYDLQNIDREKYMNILRRPRGNGNPYYKPKQRDSPPRLIVPQVESSLPLTTTGSESKILKDKDSDSTGYSQLCATKLDGESSKILHNFKIPKLKKTESQMDKPPLKCNDSKLDAKQEDDEKVEFTTSVTSTKLSVSDTDSDDHPIIQHNKKNRRRRRIHIGSDSDSDSCTLKNKELLNNKLHFNKKDQRPVISKSFSESNDDDLIIDDLPSNESDLSDSDSKDTSIVIENKRPNYGVSAKSGKIKGSVKVNKSIRNITSKPSKSSKISKKKLLKKLQPLLGKKKASKILKYPSLSDVQDLGPTKLTRQKHEVFKDIFPHTKKYNVIIPVPKSYVYTLVDEAKQISGKRQKKSERLCHVDNLESSVEILSNEDDLVDLTIEREELDSPVADQEADVELEGIAEPDQMPEKLYSITQSSLLSVKKGFGHPDERDESCSQINNDAVNLISFTSDEEKISSSNIDLSISKAIESMVTGEQIIDLSNEDEGLSLTKKCEISNIPSNKTKQIKENIKNDETVAIKMQESIYEENSDLKKVYIREKNINDIPGIKDWSSSYIQLREFDNKTCSAKDKDFVQKSKNLYIRKLPVLINRSCASKFEPVIKRRKIGNIVIERQSNKKNRRITRKWHKGYKTSNILNSLNHQEYCKERVSSSSSGELYTKISSEVVVEEMENKIVGDCRTNVENNFILPTSLFEVDLEDTEITDLTNINPSIENEMDIFETFPTSSSSLVDAFDSSSAIIKKYDVKESNDEEKKRIKLISEELVETANKFTEKEFKSQTNKLTTNFENKADPLTHEEDEEFSISDEVNQLVESLDQSFSDSGSTSVELHKENDEVQIHNNISRTTSDDNELKTFIQESHDSLEISENSLHNEDDDVEKNVLTDCIGNSKGRKDSFPSAEPLISCVQQVVFNSISCAGKALHYSCETPLHAEPYVAKTTLTEGIDISDVVLNESGSFADSLSETDNVASLTKPVNIDSGSLEIEEVISEDINIKNNSISLETDIQNLQERDSYVNSKESLQTVENYTSTLASQFPNEGKKSISETDDPMLDSEAHESDNDDIASVGIGSSCSINDENSLISGEERERDICTPDSSGSVVNKKLRKEKVSHSAGFGLIDRRRITRGTLVVPQTETILWDDGGCVDLFQCDQCDYVGKQRVSHLINFHSEREIPCQFRKEDFSPVLKDSLGPLHSKPSKIVKLNLTKIPKQMVFDSEVKCKTRDCDYISSNRFDFIYHLLEHKPEAVSTMSHCRLCNFMSDNHEEFYDHVASHTGEYRHRCDRCGQRGFSITVLKYHHKDYHGTQTEQFTSDKMILENEWPYIYVCKMCLYVQIHVRNIEDHNNRKHNGRADIVKANMSRNIVIHVDELEDNVPRKLIVENKNLGAKLNRKSKVHLRKLKKRRKKLKVTKLSSQMDIDQKHDDIDPSSETESNISIQENQSITTELGHHVGKQPKIVVKKVNNIPVFLGQEQQKELEPEKHVDQIVNRILSNSFISRSSVEIKKKISGLDDILRKVDNQCLEDSDDKVIENIEKIETRKVEDPAGRTISSEKEVDAGLLSLGHLDAKNVNNQSLEKRIGQELATLDGIIEGNASDDALPLKDDRPTDKKLDNHSNSLYQTSPEKHQLTNLISRLKTTLLEKLEDKIIVDKDDTTSEQDNSDSDNQLVICEDEDEIDNNCNSFSSLHCNSTTQEASTSFNESMSGLSFQLDISDGIGAQKKMCEGLKFSSSSELSSVKQRQIIQNKASDKAFKITDQQKPLPGDQFSSLDNEDSEGEVSWFKIKSVESLHPKAASEVFKNKVEDTLQPCGTTASKLILPSTLSSGTTSKPHYGDLYASKPSHEISAVVKNSAPGQTKLLKPNVLNVRKLSDTVDLSKSLSDNKNANLQLDGGETLPSYPPTVPLLQLFVKYQTTEIFIHYISSKASEVFKCMISGCTFVTDTPVSFEMHMENHLEIHRSGNLRCCYCLLKCPSVNHLVQHILQEHSHCQFQCKYCLYRAYTKVYLGVHLKKFHPNKEARYIKVGVINTDPPPNPPIENFVHPYKCTFENCIFRTVDSDAFKVHARSHGIDFVLQCLFCDVSARVDDIVKSLIEVKMCVTRFLRWEGLPQGISLLFGSSEYLDQFCLVRLLRTFDLLLLLKDEGQHMHDHMMNEYQCPYCLFGEAARDKLLTHLLNCHPGRPGKVLLRKQVSSPSPSIPAVLSYPSPIIVSSVQSSSQAVSTATLAESLSVPLSTASKASLAMPASSNNSFVHSKKSSLYPSGSSNFTKDEANYVIDDSPITSLITTTAAISTAVKSITPIMKENTTFVSNPVRVPAAPHGIGETLTGKTPDELQSPNNTNTVDIGVSSEISSSPIVSQLLPRESTSETNGLLGNALYRCGNEKCCFSCDTQMLLKEHLQVCDFSRDSPLLKCFHCSKSFRYFGGLLEHLKIHGPKRYICGVEGCEYRGPVLHLFRNHMKQVHHNGSYKTVIKDFSNKNPETQEFLVFPKDIVSSIREPHKKRKNEFSIEDFDKIPQCHISYNDLKCYHCTYVTKVRLNIIKHLLLHKKIPGHINQPDLTAESAKTIPAKQPTNPVPRLGSTELMFDKMMNLAGSSVEDKRKLVENELRNKNPIPSDELDQIPVFVPEEKLNSCGVEGCNYLSCDETMLKYHIKTLHSEVGFFLCPHCPNYNLTLDDIGTHFKLHGEKLYRCGWCTFLTTRQALVERHIKDIHPSKTSFHFTLRETDSKDYEDNEMPEDGCLNENSLSLIVKSNLQEDSNLHEYVNQSGSSINLNMESEPLWQCGNCSFRSVTQQEMVNHTTIKHEVKSQYKCGFCNLKSSVTTSFEAHFASKHPDKDFKVLCMFYRLDSSDIEPLPPGGSTTSHEPLWRRNDPDRKKQIRGILLEECLDTEDSAFAEPSGEEFVCPKCRSFKTPCINTFRSHLCKEANYQRFECKECGVTRPLLPNLRRHYTKTHGSTFTSDSYLTLPVDTELETWLESIIDKQEQMILLCKESKVKTQNDDLTLSKATSYRRVSSGITDTSNTLEEEDVEVVDLLEPGTEKEKHSCLICGVECRSATGLKVHITACHQVKVKCQFCTFSSKTKFGIRRHCALKHANNGNSEELEKEKVEKPIPESISFKHECPMCSFKTNSTQSFYTHKQIHQHVRDYVCEYCNNRFPSNKAGNIHSTLKHPSEPSKIVYRPLGINDKEENENSNPNLVNYQNLPAPNVEVKQELVYTCCHCSEKGSFPNVEEHIKARHNNLQFLVRKEIGTMLFVEIYKYRCNHCNNDSTSLTEVMNHWMQNHVTLDFKFSLFLFSSTPKTGISSAAESKSSVTSKIIENFSPVPDSSLLSDDSPIKEIRSNDGSSDSETDQVSSTSEKGTVVKCGYCRKISAKKSEIQEHIKKSHRGKPLKINVYQREEYDRTFKGKGSHLEFQKHSVAAHPGSEADFSRISRSTQNDYIGFRCDVCGHVVKHLKSIKSHMRRNHAEKNELYSRVQYDSPVLPFKCNYCGDKVATRLEMDRHHEFLHSHLPRSCTNSIIEARQSIHSRSPSSFGSDKMRTDHGSSSIPSSAYSTPSSHHSLPLPDEGDSSSHLLVIPLKNTARKSFPSSAAPKHVKRQIATKSTSGRRLQLALKSHSSDEETEENSLPSLSTSAHNFDVPSYRRNDSSLDNSGIFTNFNLLGGPSAPLSFSQLSTIMNLNPKVKLYDYIKSNEWLGSDLV